MIEQQSIAGYTVARFLTGDCRAVNRQMSCTCCNADIYFRFWCYLLPH